MMIELYTVFWLGWTFFVLRFNYNDLIGNKEYESDPGEMDRLCDLTSAALVGSLMSTIAFVIAAFDAAGFVLLFSCELTPEAWYFFAVGAVLAALEGMCLAQIVFRFVDKLGRGVNPSAAFSEMEREAGSRGRYLALSASVMKFLAAIELVLCVFMGEGVAL